MREHTPWERLDGVKYALDSILEHAFKWEQERIIKLLEEYLTGCSGYDCERCGEVEGLSTAIALIKGEK